MTMWPDMRRAAPPSAEPVEPPRDLPSAPGAAALAVDPADTTEPPAKAGRLEAGAPPPPPLLSRPPGRALRRRLGLVAALVLSGAAHAAVIGYVLQRVQPHGLEAATDPVTVELLFETISADPAETPDRPASRAEAVTSPAGEETGPVAEPVAEAVPPVEPTPPGEAAPEPLAQAEPFGEPLTPAEPKAAEAPENDIPIAPQPQPEQAETVGTVEAAPQPEKAPPADTTPPGEMQDLEPETVAPAPLSEQPPTPVEPETPSAPEVAVPADPRPERSEPEQPETAETTDAEPPSETAPLVHASPQGEIRDIEPETVAPAPLSEQPPTPAEPQPVGASALEAPAEPDPIDEREAPAARDTAEVELPERMALLPGPRPAPPARARQQRPAATAQAERRASPPASARREPAPRATAPAARETRRPSAGAAAATASAPARAASAGEQAQYARRLASHVERHKRYPAAAARQRLTGATRLAITIDRSGGLAGARVAAGSGHAVLDAEALAVARRAAPYPPPPDGIGERTFSFTVTLRFTR